MHNLRKTLFLSLAFSFSLVALSLGVSQSTSAASQADTEANYVYSAVAGDSYTELARASVVRYDLDTASIDLAAAQVTAAETWVTQDAGSPQIQVGQEVLVSKDLVQKYAEKVAGLSEESKAKWQVYADRGSITNGELKDKVRDTVSETSAKVEAEKKVSEQKSEEAKQAAEDATSSEKKSSSKKWVIIAIVILLVLAAATLIRSSNQKDE